VTDYYSILSRAISETGSNTPEARTALYDRVQGMLAEQFQTNRVQWTESRMRAELTHLEAAIDRIEAESARKGRAAADDRPDWRAPPRRPDAVRMPDEGPSQPRRRIVTPIFLGLIGIAIATVVAAMGYIYWPGASKRAIAPEIDARAKAPSNQTAVRTGNFGIDTEELPPGVDGGSTEVGLPYFYRRQPIYYRTTYSAGMIIIDRSQRFLYLVQPQSIALRYGIGVGGECPRHVGLQRISRMVEWPEWAPSADLLKRRSYPARVAGGPGSPLGARVLYFEGNAVGIHGTNAPKTIGQALSLGCYRLVNDSIVDLYKRVSTGAGVVVLN
jgi:lipoprotein-anchoring transpeptidase ErfK/SrfK